MFCVLIIMGTIYGSISIGFRAKRRAEAAIAPVRAATAAADLVAQDLENALPPTGTLASQFLGQPQGGGAGGEADTLDFSAVGDDGPITGQDRLNPQPLSEGIRQIELTLRTDVSPSLLVRRVLRRGILATNEEDPQEEVLCRDVKSFTMEYYDGTAWYPQWDSSDASTQNVLPVAVRITIELNRDKNETTSGVYRIQRIVPLSCASIDDLLNGSTGGSSIP
jgi:hypothetical protein